MKTSSRRTFLQGTGGAALALPWLESLALAGPNAAGPTAAGPAQRLAVFYVPIGVVRRGFFPNEANVAFPGFNSDPTVHVEGKFTQNGWHDLPTTPTLQPLARVREKVTLITGMDRTFQNGTDVHAQCASCFLSSAAPYDNSIRTSAWPLDRTLDHVVADQIAGDTPFPTLEFSCNSHKDNKESIYFDNISWYGTGHVAPSLRDPLQVYQRLFGTEEQKSYQAITDLVLGDARSLKQELGYSDRHKFDEYFDAVRTIEQRIDRMDAMRSELANVSIDEPATAQLPRGEYIRLMGDLMIIAFQTGLTNVATLMIGPERWDSPYMFDGLFDKPMSHHKMSHNQKTYTPELLKVDHFHMQQFAYLVEKMDSIVESNGTTMLDNTLLTYGSGLGDGATHQYNDLPIVVAGGKALGFTNGGHLHCPNGTPLANLWLTQARAMGVKRDRFADSTGMISELVS
ncbi:MAG: DUF1552 domain-containing protein [Pirellulaceae bacterium]|nr:DUF1552 domain-containing protein [Pirellulaceae bacterium]